MPFATAYNLKRATISGGPYTPLTNGLAGASFTDSGLANGTTYFYILTATNQFGESAPSPEASATAVPSVGSNISAARIGSGVTVSWPSAYVGWILQTNTVGLDNPTAWGDVPDSVTRSQMTFPAGGPAAPTEFFRLRHP
ncbi:MAG: fibronectin type III domain-containing protein [Verrucomicrobiota bacterium]